MRPRWLVLCGAVLVLLAPGCTGEDGGAGSTADAPTAPPPATTEAAPTEIQPPTAFTAERAEAFSVDLSWAAPTGEPAAERFTVFRDGTFVAAVSGTQLAYTDDGVSPGRTYDYEVVARAGELVSEPATTEATTPTPPLRAARLEGVFNVRTKVVSSSGYSRLGGAPVYGWRFRPRCPAGPCDVRWRDLQRAFIRAVLDRRGGRYRGTYTGFFNAFCSGSKTTSTVTIDLKVTRARAVEGEWRATRLEGTLEQSEASQLGCVTSGATLTLRGRLIP
jgi:hypothetical protein